MTASKKPAPSHPVTPMGIWDVQGSFILLGTRDKLTFGPVRVVGPNKTIASAGLVETLNGQFSKELSNMPRVAFQKVGFSRGFALMHLTWTPVAAKAAAKDLQDIAVEALADRTDPPALNETA